MTTTLVTGGAGFIGSHLVDRLLAAGDRVIVLDDFNDYYDPAIKRANVEGFGSRAEVVAGDVRDRRMVRETIAAARPDRVVHLAARAGVRPSVADPYLYLETNAGGTLNVLEAMRETGTPRLLFAGTSSCYGKNPTPFREDQPLDHPISPYAASKIAGEALCRTYADLYGLRVVILRFFTVYGPRQRPDLAIHKFTRLIDEGRPIPVFGDGSMRRDHTFIDDILQGVLAALAYEGPLCDTFNLGESRTVRLDELIRIVEQAVGRPAVIERRPVPPGDVPITHADIGKARSLLNYDPRTPIEEGVPVFVEWYRAYRSRAAGNG